MTFAAAGSAVTATAATFSLTPHGVGNFLLVEVISETAADYATALSSSNAVWSVLVAHTSLSANAVAATVFIGQVTSTSPATVTVTLAAGSPVLRVSGQEFSTSAGFSAVTLDASGTVNAATTLCPSLTPGHGTGELYWYYGFNAGSATAGGTSGYTYDVDANGNGTCFDAACGSGAQQPAWGASDTISGIAVLMYESAASLTAAASLAVTPVLSAAATQSGPGSRTAALAVTPARSVSHVQAHARHAALALSPARSAAGARTGLVQEVSGSTTGTSLTLTFPHAVTLGSAVIVCVAGFYSGGVTGMTLGTSGGTFSHFASSGGTGGNNAGIYGNLSAAQSSATLTITTSAAGILAWAYEVAGEAVYFDGAKGSTGSGTSWTSTATPATVPYQHFAVGIGSVIANSGSITSTGSGWTSESAITGVVGAGSHAVGAVSGYRQPSSSGAYTYSGTSGSSSAWGAVAASFLVLPRGGSTWGGYIFTEHAAAGYTGVTASFTLPSSLPLASAICSIWVGIGNVYQTGVYLSSSSSFTGNVGSSPWSWWFGGGGGAGELWDAATYPTGAGDSLSLSLTCDGEYWYATITNNSRGWSYSEPKSVLGNNVGSWGYNGTTGAPASWGWIYPVGAAEVIIEQEGGPPNQLPDYGVITFTGVTTTPPATVLPSPQFTVPTVTGSITQYPGPYSLAAGSFTMNWHAAD